MTSFIKALFYIVLSWVLSLLFVFLIAKVITASGQSMSWYCKPYVLIGLYVVPGMLVMCGIHYWQATHFRVREILKIYSRHNNIVTSKIGRCIVVYIMTGISMHLILHLTHHLFIWIFSFYNKVVKPTCLQPLSLRVRFSFWFFSM